MLDEKLESPIWNPEAAGFFQRILNESEIQKTPIFLADCQALPDYMQLLVVGRR